jgi:hypothetical protein
MGNSENFSLSVLKASWASSFYVQATSFFNNA